MPKQWLCLNINHTKHWPQQNNHTKILTVQVKTTPKHRLCKNIDRSKTFTTPNHCQCQNITCPIRMPCKWMQHYVMLVRDNPWGLLQHHFTNTLTMPKHRPHQNINCDKTSTVTKYWLCLNIDHSKHWPQQKKSTRLKHWPCRLKLSQNIDLLKTLISPKHWQCQDINRTTRITCKCMQHYVMLPRNNP